MFSARIVSILLYSRFTADSTGAAPVKISLLVALTGFIFTLHQFRDFLTAIVQSRRFSFFLVERMESNHRQIVEGVVRKELKVPTPVLPVCRDFHPAVFNYQYIKPIFVQRRCKPLAI